MSPKFTLFIAGLLLYALTWGKRDLKRLDAWMARRIAPRAGTADTRRRPYPER